MRVGLIAYLLHSGAGYRDAGVSIFIRQLLTHLPSASAKNDYVAFHGRTGDVPNGIESVLSPLPTDKPPIRIAWEQSGFLLQSATQHLDLTHGLVNVVPLVDRRPSVVTVHDLSFLRVPGRLPPAKARYLRAAVKLSVRKAGHVICVSQNTRRDVIELFDKREDRVSVAYPGVDARFHVLDGDESALLRKRHFGGRPFILYVGTLEPRKNVDVLIRAYAELRRGDCIPHALALVGARGWMYGPLFSLVQELRLDRDVFFVDYVPSAELPTWYGAAEVFAYVSAYEGFGFPVVEAMACGVPVVTSSSSSLGELAGGACLTVGPGSIVELQSALRALLSDPSLRSRLRGAGLARAAQFDWGETARETVKVYQQVVGAAVE